MKKFLLAAAAAALFAASPAAAAGFEGVVVARSGSTLAVAAPSGLVHAVHLRSNARVGSVVRVAGSRVAVVGRAHHVRFRGVVVRNVGSSSFLAAGGMLLAVHTHARHVAAVGDTGPAPGTVVNTTATVGANGSLTQQSAQTVGRAGTVTVQATVTSVGAGTVTITVNGQTLTLPLPSGLTLPSNIVGSAVTLSLSLGGGTTTATPEADEQDGDTNDDEGDNGDDDGEHGGGGDD